MKTQNWFWGAVWIIFWYFTGHLTRTVLTGMGYTEPRALILAVLSVSGVSCVSLSLLMRRKKRLGPVREQNRQAEKGANWLLTLPPQEALRLIGRLIFSQENIQFLPTLLCWRKGSAKCGFSVLHLPKGSVLAADVLCALVRDARREGCDFLYVMPLFEPVLSVFPAFSAPPRVILLERNQTAPILARFAPKNDAPASAPRLKHGSGEKLFRTGGAMVLSSLLLRTMLLPGLLLICLSLWLKLHPVSEPPCPDFPPK